MSRSENNLHAVLADTAAAIKAKKGDSTAILPRDFADEINNLPSGGGTVTLNTTLTSISVLTSSKYSPYQTSDGFTLTLDASISNLGYLKNGFFYPITSSTSVGTWMKNTTITVTSSAITASHPSTYSAAIGTSLSEFQYLYAEVDGSKYLLISKVSLGSTNTSVTWTQDSMSYDSESVGSSYRDINLESGHSYKSQTFYPVRFQAASGKVVLAASSAMVYGIIQTA